MSAEPLLPDAIHSLPEALAFWAEAAPDAAAIIRPGAPVITYAALWHTVRPLASSLAAAFGRADRIVLFLPEGAAQITSMLAAMHVGLAVPLLASLTAAELDRALAGLRAAVALVPSELDPAIRECFGRHGVSLLDPSARSNDQGLAAPWPRADDLAVVRQTSGTTGRPKRVPATHGTMMAHGRRTRDRLGLRFGDRGPLVAPLATTLGSAVLSHAITAGAALILPPRTGGFAADWAAIVAADPTWLSTAAGYLELLARHLDAQPEQPPPRALRFVQVTAAPITPAVLEGLGRQLGAPILPRYSATETGAIAMTFPPPAPARAGSAGQPVQEVRVVGHDAADVAPGAEGEIWVRGPRVMAGYLDDPDATAAVLSPDGWYRTGDLGYLDEDGFLFLTGRLNELINRGGEKIAPSEVDDVLLAHPAVAEGAAFAVPDARLGEDIAVAVVVRDGAALTPRELRSWMLHRLSPAKVPRRIWFVVNLPRTVTGKVQRGVLAERYARR